MVNVLVNATSIKSGGALNILNQFIINSDDNLSYTVVIDSKVSVDIDKENFTVVKKSNDGRFSRIIWDFYGIKKFIKKSSSNFDVVISLQNTTMNVGNIKQIVYLHQGLFLHDRKWSFLLKQERKYAMYKYIYPIFVFAFIKNNTHFVVQTEWMKKALNKKFLIDQTRISVIKPDVVPWTMVVDKKTEVIDSSKKLYMFYPASSELFKNHYIVLAAIKYLHESGFDISFFDVYFTVSLDAFSNEIQNYITSNESAFSSINLLGEISYDDVKYQYDCSDVVLFPSEIESFGLPLLEAAMLGKHILCLDTPFAREVLHDYSGVEFLTNDIKEWASAFIRISKHKPFSHVNYIPSYSTSWCDFFNLIKS